MERSRSLNRAAAWFERTRRPGWLIAAVAVVLYLPSLGGGFVLDDHRAMRVLREYHRGERAQPDVYRFLTGDPERNRAEREAGWYPWWMQDRLKYQHFRPLAERILYLQFLAFGERPLGYRLVSLGLYAVGVLLVLRMLRLFSGEERVARWGALAFAVSAGHAIPVTFVSAQGDVVALVCGAGAVLAAAAGPWALVLFVGLFAAGLGVKEVCLALAAAPLLIRPGAAVLHCATAPGSARTRGRLWGFLALCAAALVAAGWLALYVRGGYGSNTATMVDPISGPLGYLAAAPKRAVILLSTWIIPINPFLFNFQLGGLWAETVYLVIGGAALAAIGAFFWRRLRRRRGVGRMVVWVVMFLPILVCTPPDDRVMMLPGIGLAMLAAVWMTHPRRDGAPGVRRIPFVLFIVIQGATAPVTAWAMQTMERMAQENLRTMAASFGRPLKYGDRIYVVNCPFAFDGLFMQDRLRTLPGCERAHASPLCDVADRRITQIDERTLRIEAWNRPLLSGFLGRMGIVRGGGHHIGETYSGDGFRATISELSDGGVQAATLQFERPIADEGVRFFELRPDGPPKEVELDGFAR